MSKSLMSKILKIGGEQASSLEKSDFAKQEITCSTPVPIVNLMLSGSLSGGLRAGITQVCGMSRVFKSNWCLLLVKAYLDTHSDSICVFFDNEFGAAHYFKTFDIDESRVVHMPVSDVEELKIKTVQILEEIEKGQKVIFFLDSLSQIASIKETEDALNAKTVADMSRAKAITSFMRLITPRLTLKDIPFLIVNNAYESIGGNPYAERTVKGGAQVLLSASTVLWVSRSVLRDSDKTLTGWSFNYEIMKSRHVKDKSKFSLTVTYEGGIDKNSGLFDLALSGGFIYTEKQGFYRINLAGFDPEKSWRRKALEDEQSFFDTLLKNEEFQKYCHDKYSLETGNLISDDSHEPPKIDEETGEIISI